MTTTYTTKEEVDAIHAQLKETFLTGLTKDLAWRRWQLKQCWWLVADNEALIREALRQDLRKHPLEVGFELSVVKTDILDHIKNLEAWTATQPAAGAGLIFGWLGRGRVRKEPLGTTLIIGAWNAPVAVVLQPLVAALAAGCCAVLKPSELAPHTAAALADLVPKYLDPRAVRVATGGPAETAHMLDKRWNHIFYTGSAKVARIIAAAAARHLTPMVLELGGQGPCIVTKTADVDFAARRIAWNSFLNAGQICMSVNHVFAEPEVAERLLERLAHWSAQLLKTPRPGGAGAGKEVGEDQMCRIVNERHYDRIAGLLEKTAGEVVYGGLGESDRAGCLIHPTVVRLGPLNKPAAGGGGGGGGSALDDSLMSEEIFGPVTPVITATVDEAIGAVNALPEALALYIFTADRAVTERILDRTSSGGVTVNNVMMHAQMHGAPFGGVGESGYGAYHGAHGVEQFCHRRPVVEPPGWLDSLMGFMYPPYGEGAAAKLEVKNTLGFKRGETLEDQRKTRWFGWLGLWF